MFAILRRSSMVFALTAGLALSACSGGGDTDVVGTDASDRGTDMGITGDVVNPHDAGDTGVVTDTGMTGTCAAAMLGTCNAISNAGCMSGTGCYLANDGSGGVTGMCVSVGTVAVGEACSSANDCIQGLACLGEPGRCVKLCCGPGDNDTCRNGPGFQRGSVCSIPITGLPIYGCQATMNCDWFAQDCANGNNCEPTDATGTTTCTTIVGTGVDGDACGSSTGAVNCALGYTCITIASDAGTGGAACRQVCDPTVSGTDAGTPADGGVARTCPTDRHCGRVTDRPNNYGVCVP
jgi:hypothetical protein